MEVREDCGKGEPFLLGLNDSSNVPFFKTDGVRVEGIGGVPAQVHRPQVSNYFHKKSEYLGWF